MNNGKENKGFQLLEQKLYQERRVFGIEDILVEEHGLKNLSMLLKKYQVKRACAVSDRNIIQALGGEIWEGILQEPFVKSAVVFQELELVPDEAAVVRLLTEIPEDCDFIIGVGSGTINDLCKFISFKMKLDYMIVASAPSMDGYASSGAPLIIRHLKTTYPAKPPRAILADVTFMSGAPKEMIASGIGDMLGKYVCLADWEISHVITGEEISEEAVKAVRQSIRTVVSNAKSAMEGKPQGIQSIIEGLIYTGLAMSSVGNSRPASGSEHHLSHYWEMMFLMEGKEDPLHGIKVGIGTVASLYMYQELKKELEKKELKKLCPFDEKRWEQEIREAYKEAAEGVLILESRVHKNRNREVERRRQALEENLAHIVQIIEELPRPEVVLELLESIGAPCYPKDLGISEEVFRRSICYAKDLRNRFGLLQLLFDCGLQREISEKAIQYLY